MKIAFKNFLTTLRRYKAASVLNIAGLTLAFTAFYVILVQVWWEMGYNRSLPQAEQIYLVESENWYEPGQWSSWLNRPIAERTIASTPGVEAGGCMWGGFGDGTCWTRNEASFGYNKFTASNGSVSLPLLDVFGFRSLEGDVHDLKKPKSVIVSHRAADQMNVKIGDLLWANTEEPKPEDAREVVAIFADFPANSLLGNCEVVNDLGDYCLEKRSDWSFNYFVKLHAGADPAAFSKRWIEVERDLRQAEAERMRAAGEEVGRDEDPSWGVRLSPVRDLYFETDSEVPCQQGSRATTYTLLGIAVLVIVLAFINFVNFFFALVPVRIRTVNTFKVFGAPTSSLRFSFVFEAFGLVVISLLTAWYISFAVQGTEFASYIDAPLAVSQNGAVVLILVAVAFAMTLAASLYPAYYITSFDPRAEAGEIQVASFDEELGKEYASERKLTAIVGLFTLLSVVIALMGVFGIVLFETQHRRREIAVRRVMGASQGEILGMFNRRYVTLVCICFLLAAPVSGRAVHRWLTGFAYATPMSWWVFAAAFTAVLAVTMLTVTVRSWRAANENPADCVKSE